MNKTLLWVAIGILIADRASKEWAIVALKQQQTVIDLLPVLRFIYVENTGVAFGIFADNGDLVRWLLIALTLIITGVLFYYLRQTPHRGEKWACLLMLSGAVGNLVDRIALGYVVDFVDVYWGNYHWPAFNVADMAISAGGMLFALFLIKGMREQ
ncbi:MAG: signal peptidase II [Proteobacteria bacterium]|nr:signal peptidase II [Pseudomonadota bacterium]